MTESIERHHALESFLRGAVVAAGENTGVQVEIRPQLDYINLRGDPADGAFLSAVRDALNQGLPIDANTMTCGAVTVYWLGPGEWLLTTADGRGMDLAESLETALDDIHASVNSLSGGYIAMRIRGNECAALLAKGCTLDLHPRAFSAGDCAQTGLGKANVLLAKVDDQPTVDLFVRRSFAEYVALWLQHAGAEYGIRFSTAE